MTELKTLVSGAKQAPGSGLQKPSAKEESQQRTSWYLVSPLVMVLGFFLVLPIITIVIVSFWDYNDFNFFPAFVFENYAYLLTSKVTLATYLKTFKFMVWCGYSALLLGSQLPIFWRFMCAHCQCRSHCF